MTECILMVPKRAGNRMKPLNTVRGRTQYNRIAQREGEIRVTLGPDRLDRQSCLLVEPRHQLSYGTCVF